MSKFLSLFLYQSMTRMLVFYFGSIVLSLICSICFIFFPKIFWPFHSFIWMVPLSFILYRLINVVVCLCSCRWGMMLKGMLMLILEFAILATSFFLLILLFAIYNDDSRGSTDVYNAEQVSVIFRRTSFSNRGSLTSIHAAS